jgi:hypothetical protein
MVLKNRIFSKQCERGCPPNTSIQLDPTNGYFVDQNDIGHRHQCLNYTPKPKPNNKYLVNDKTLDSISDQIGDLCERITDFQESVDAQFKSTQRSIASIRQDLRSVVRTSISI